MINREKYINRISPFINKPVIKIITGIRRCGKSTFLRILIEDLKNKKVNQKNILFINKDSLEFDHINSYNELNAFVLEKFEGVKGN